MISGMSELKIYQMAVVDLKPATYNPRKISDKQKEELIKSIQQFGLVDPIIVNNHPKRKGIVIGGHQRLAIAKLLVMETVPVVLLNLTEAKERELNLRLNKNTGDWDLDLLKGFDIDQLLDVGFDETELSDIWSDTLSVEDDGFDVEKAIKAIKKPKAKFGEVYQLGVHRISCNDATDLAAVQVLVGKERMDLVTLDPVYGIGLDYHKGISTKGKYSGAERDQLKGKEYRDFLKTVMKNALEVSRNDVHLYVWNDQRHIGLVQSLIEECGLHNKSVCLWIKNNFTPVPGIAWNKSYEACMYGVRGKPYLNPDVRNLTEVLNKEIDPGNRQIDDVIDLFDLWLVKRLPAQEYQHATQKPLDVYEKPLRRCSKVGANVLDLFSGSGTTLMACEQMKRRAFVMEKDPVFVDVCIQRFEEATGNKAKKR
ncbi:hypothetical protein COV05_00100 [Candidatus Uhrbacteria bacterium CG10_big_fil_rev_8_21_14_0_10_48_16]|uniref:Methyltransferase n=1 Tax=Candidatus Uhrbacteria bacterium CG10_big_fil_rev_8_21_14_0_10_48_16 TaxID=1975038 RepID=A0A2M8LIH4_9BACT|nr:MAG: hypothetical protein COV05_00100 [Candidatus Uhrbacteria bacterium CG10_big_fil_rev_8_21_14_0_10_48_16]